MQADGDKHTDVVQQTSANGLRKIKYTLEEYQATIWPFLRNAASVLLTSAPEQLRPVSYMEIYRFVYDAYCNDFGEQLMNDLTGLIENHLKAVSLDVQIGNHGDIILRYVAALRQYNYALASIAASFSYLNLNFVRLRPRRSDLEREFKEMFCRVVCDPRHQEIIAALNELSQRDAAPPDVVTEVVQNLYTCKPEYVQAHLHPQLFTRYLPGIEQPSQENNPGQSAEEDGRQQAEPERGTEVEAAGEQTEKRPAEEGKE